MSISDLCNRTVIVTRPQTSVAEAAKLMREHHVGDLVVIDEGKRPVAIVTDRDIVVFVMAKELDPASITVSDVCSRDIETMPETADFFETLTHMRRCAVRRMPIVDDEGRLQGLVTLDDALELINEALGDLVALVSREIEREADRVN